MIVTSTFRRTTSLLVVLVAATLQNAQGQETLTSEGLEHVAAMDAHQICAGLFVVGRDIQRNAVTVVARDVAPFEWFRWNS